MNFFSLFKRKILYKIKKKINIDLDEVHKKTLDNLFYNYGSDKADIFKQRQDQGHGFSKFYDQHLKHLKKKEIKILEIGSYAGASAAAFIKYFENSSVYCFDINISKFVFSSKNIHVYGLDINNENELKKILEKIKLETNSNFFDIIIDDGSHYLSDILFSLKTLFKYVKKGGFYIIDDLLPQVNWPEDYPIKIRDLINELENDTSDKKTHDTQHFKLNGRQEIVDSVHYDNTALSVFGDVR